MCVYASKCSVTTSLVGNPSHLVAPEETDVVIFPSVMPLYRNMPASPTISLAYTDRAIESSLYLTFQTSPPCANHRQPTATSVTVPHTSFFQYALFPPARVAHGCCGSVLSCSFSYRGTELSREVVKLFFSMRRWGRQTFPTDLLPLITVAYIAIPYALFCFRSFVQCRSPPVIFPLAC